MINAVAIIAIAWLSVVALMNIGEPYARGLLLIILIILVLLGYIDLRKRLLDALFKGKRPADGDMFRFARLLLKVINVMTALIVLLIWTFAWFYLREQLFWAVIDTGFLVSPVICLNLLLFLRDCIAVSRQP